MIKGLEKEVDYKPKNRITEISDAIEKIVKRTNTDYKPQQQTIEPDDSSRYQQILKLLIIGTDGAKEASYIPQQQKKLLLENLFSYVGSGVTTAAETPSNDTRQKTEQIKEPPTPRQGSRIIEDLIAEAVLRTGSNNLDPTTKEHMRTWLLTPEGKVWRTYAERTAPIRTADYNLNLD